MSLFVEQQTTNFFGKRCWSTFSNLISNSCRKKSRYLVIRIIIRRFHKWRQRVRVKGFVMQIEEHEREAKIILMCVWRCVWTNKSSLVSWDEKKNETLNYYFVMILNFGFFLHCWSPYFKLLLFHLKNQFGIQTTFQRFLLDCFIQKN